MKPRATLYAPAVFFIAAAGAFLASPNVATAANQTWTNSGTGDWFTGTNWSGGSAPAGGEDALLNNGGTAQIVNNFTPQLATVFIRNGGVSISGSNSSLLNGASYVGYSSGDNGTVGVSGSGSSWFSSQFYIGYSGTGSVSILNGGEVIDTSGSQTEYIGVTAQGNGTVTISGTNSRLNKSSGPLVSIHIGEQGKGTVTLANGGTVRASTVSLGVAAGSRGTLNFGAYAGGDTAGTLTATNIVFGAGTGTINFNQTNSMTFSTPISGTGTVVQHGSGTTTLTGTQSYSGNTAVNIGTLLINGSLSSATNAVAVAQNSTLGGTGTISGATAVSGILAPGNNGIGTLTINNNVSMDSTSVLVMELSGSSSYDQLYVGGAFTVNSNAQLTLSLVNGYSPAEGDSFTLLTGNRAVFATNRMNLPGLSSGLFWNTAQLGTTGQISVVPEPATTGLLIVGLAFCGLWRFCKVNFPSNNECSRTSHPENNLVLCRRAQSGDWSDFA